MIFIFGALKFQCLYIEPYFESLLYTITADIREIKAGKPSSHLHIPVKNNHGTNVDTGERPEHVEDPMVHETPPRAFLQKTCI